MIFLEHFLTYFENDMKSKEHVLDQVWDILQRTYKPIGGIANLQNKEQLLELSNTVWKLVRRGNSIVAVAIYKTKSGGRKLVCGGSDGTPEGKKSFYQICYEDVTRIERDSWSEVSGALEHVFLFKYQGVPIPATLAQKILVDDELTISKDGFHYTRLIGGKPLEKIMFGNIPKQFRSDDWEKEGSEYRDTYLKYSKEHPEEAEIRRRSH